MDTAEFWDLIEESARRHQGRDDRTEWLVGELSRGTVADILDFQTEVDRLSSVAMTWLLWGAAYRILGFCSDDSFTDFRRWLIGLGREAFADVLASADALADLPQARRLAGRARGDWTSDEWPGWEKLGYAASYAYERLGFDDADDFYDLMQERPKPGERRRLADERWDLDDPTEAAQRLPRLTGLFARDQK